MIPGRLCFISFPNGGLIKFSSRILNLSILTVYFLCSTMPRDILGLSPCNFPTPDSPALFYDLCTRYLDLPYLCDLDQVFSKSGADKIEDVVQVFKDVFDQRDLDKVQLSIVILKNLQVPTFVPKVTDISSSKEFYCLSGYEPMSFQRAWNITDALIYSRVVATVIRRRWFGTDCGKHVLILAITDGITAANRSKILVSSPVIDLAFSSEVFAMLRKTDQSAEKFAKEALFEGWPLATVIQKTLEILGKQLRIAEESFNPKPIHTIPQWAWNTAFVCVVIITGAMVLEWALVRRKGLTLRSGGGAPDSGGAKKGMSKEGGPRTHMYF